MMSGLMLALAISVALLLPSSVLGGEKNCNGRGYFNATDGLCNCLSGFHGVTCSFKYCPFGPSWWSPPVADDKRNRVLLPCSNMGSCDETTGTCTCRSGFEGRACERMSCPTNLKFSTPTTIYRNGTYGLGRSLPFGLLPQDAVVETEAMSPVLPCSGHGRCLTMRDAGLQWDGLTLVTPPVQYSLWDADAVQGCVCDDGWEGYDCSRRSCLLGVDVSQTSTESVAPGAATYETVVLECQATAGYFGMKLRGQVTEPIPFDADAGYLKRAIERGINGIGAVRVVMSATAANSYMPRVCGATDVISTSITFKDRVGPHPPVYVSKSLTSASRAFGSASATQLNDGGSAPTLRMATVHTVTCTCTTVGCGAVRFAFRGNVSDSITLTGDRLATIRSKIEGISDFAAGSNPYTGFSTVSLSMTKATLCEKGQTAVTTITLYSDYGNMPALELVDDTSGGEISIASNHGAGSAALAPCSNNGKCDHDTGLCTCVESRVDNKPFTNVNKFYYRASSSDGSGTAGGSGTRHDCSYLHVSPERCYEQHTNDLVLGPQASNICQGRGFCDNATATCSCYRGYKGINCARKECPVGPAWFDEPLSATSAHNPATCSNRGHCNRETGTCDCAPGFTGPACERLMCPGYDAAKGSYCNGVGRCMTVAEMFELYGYSYGKEAAGGTYSYARPVTHAVAGAWASGGTTPPATWDAHSFHGCVCANSAALMDRKAAVVGDIQYPAVSSSANLNGIPVEKHPLPGFGGYDCSSYMCPYGNTPHQRRYNSITQTPAALAESWSDDGMLEQQRVVCTLTGTKYDSFRLQFFKHMDASTPVTYSSGTSKPITLFAKTGDIKRAIEEGVWGIGNVTVTFPNFATDGIHEACDPDADASVGGFVITWETEMGNHPLVALFDSSQSSVVTVYPHRDGTRMNAECSGETGVCDRSKGLCRCVGQGTSSSAVPLSKSQTGEDAWGYMSSNGTKARAGWRGDCGAELVS